MTRDFKVGDHVEWNSEAGRVRGTIKKKITSEIAFKGYTVPRLERGAAVFDRERQDRSRGHAQRLGPQKARQEYDRSQERRPGQDRAAEAQVVSQRPFFFPGAHTHFTLVGPTIRGAQPQKAICRRISNDGVSRGDFGERLASIGGPVTCG